jgi:hypothetical protein
MFVAAGDAASLELSVQPIASPRGEAASLSSTELSRPCDVRFGGEERTAEAGSFVPMADINRSPARPDHAWKAINPVAQSKVGLQLCRIGLSSVDGRFRNIRRPSGDRRSDSDGDSPNSAR